MERARPASPRRRPRRGSVDRPIDTRLVRKVSLVLAGPLVILFLTLSRTGSLPAPALPPSFDGKTAVALTRELVRDNPSRVPGSPGADSAARWFEEHVRVYGLAVERDTWSAHAPGLGRVDLTNLAAIVPGSIAQEIIVVAHRDNGTGTAGANDNASGTAALVELARAFATVGTGSAKPRKPLHTIVLLSTDGGAYGDLGAVRFARSTRGQGAAAVIVLDGLGGRARPHLDIGGLGRRSPPTALVRTLAARLRENGARPVLPDPLTQLAGLGIPLSLGEQAPFLGRHVPAVRVGTAPETAVAPGGDEIRSLDTSQLGRIGRAVDATLGSLDTAIELPRATGASVVLAQRAASGWAIELLLLAMLAPYSAAALDLLARCRRRGTAIDAAWHALRRRFGFWLLGLVALGVVALTGALPRGGGSTPRPDLPPVDRWPTAAIVGLALLGLLAWLRARRPFRRSVAADPEQELAGWTVALLGLLGAATLAAAANPYVLVFVLPSLYAWLAVVQVGRSRPWFADMLFGAGLLGPVVLVVVVAQQLELGLRTPLYLLALATSGTVPWTVTLAITAWLAAAAQVAALVAGRYTPLGRSSSRR